MGTERSSKNKTIVLTEDELEYYSKRLLLLNRSGNVDEIRNKTVLSDFFEIAGFLPECFIDLLMVDPPYNINKKFGGLTFSKNSDEAYQAYLDSFISLLIPMLKPHASVYICCDFFSSPAVYFVLNKYFKIRSRITWQREKGRGAMANWKNACEDIWFATLGDSYYFNLNAVKIKRRVLATYKTNGIPKDWVATEDGNFRLTCPSNFWDDISVPYWSMSENTEHPTQKPEKLLAKIILASSKEGDFIFDPFAGSGTTSVVASKLNRSYAAVEIDKYYACLTEKRLELAKENKNIQGFDGQVFLERNTQAARHNTKNKALIKQIPSE